MAFGQWLEDRIQNRRVPNCPGDLRSAGQFGTGLGAIWDTSESFQETSKKHFKTSEISLNMHKTSIN